MISQIVKCLLSSALAFFYVGIAHGQETGTLKARFLYGGDPPDAELIQVNKDVGFCGQFRHKKEHLLVDKDSKAIKNVLIYVYTGRRGSKLEPVERKPKTVTLSAVNCRFEPHILCMQAGDTLEFVQPDQVVHNANLNTFSNHGFGGTAPPGAPRRVVLEKPEPAPIPVECNIHPWMRAYVVVLDHPFAAVSDDRGNIEIKDLPAGGELIFRLFHEFASGPIREIEVAGNSLAIERNLFRLKIEPGMNDLGTVVIPAGAFKQ